MEEINRNFPSSYHSFCMGHLYANFHKYYKGNQLRDLFWSASQAYTRHKLDIAMNEIGKLCPQAKQWIENIPAIYCSQAYFPEWLHGTIIRIISPNASTK